MWRSTAVAGLVALMGVAVLSTQPTSVYACSAGPDWDPFAESTIVVGGRLTGWEIESGEARESLPPGTFPPIRVFMDVDDVFKGPLGLTKLSFIDSRSLVVDAGGPGSHDEWAGASGGCGAFDSEPTGIYAVMGLSKNNDGEYGSNRLRVFFYGEEPRGEEYERALARMASYPGAAGLPALGSGPTPSTASNHLVAGVAALGIALFGASFAIRFGTGRKI